MRYFAVALALGIGACSEPDRIDPGLWAIKAEITEFVDAPGVSPPEVINREPAPHTRLVCLTPEDVERPELFELVGAGGFGCTDTIEMAGGRLRGARSGCTMSGLTPLLSNRLTVFEGDFSARGFDIRGRSNEASSGGQRQFVAARFTARRVRECPTDFEGEVAAATQPEGGLNRVPPGIWQVRREYLSWANQGPRPSDHGGWMLYCVAEDQSRPPINLFERTGHAPQCTEALRVQDGRLSGSRSCRYPEELERRTRESLQGVVTSESFRVRLQARSITVTPETWPGPRFRHPSAQGLMLSGRRIGDC